MISPQQALALRRLLLTTFGLTATVAAHALCSGLELTRAAPAAWGMIACVAVVAGPRWGGRWREWSPAGLLARLLAVELALHVLLTGAPWAFGITVHHSPPLITPAILLAHGAVVMVLGLVLLGAQRLLSVAQRLVHALRRALRRAPAAAAPRLPAHRDAATPPHSLRWRPRGARGPPAPAS